jgi:hypothetical protein
MVLSQSRAPIQDSHALAFSSRGYKFVERKLAGKLASRNFAPVDIELRDWVTWLSYTDKFVALAAVPVVFEQSKARFGSSILGT